MSIDSLVRVRRTPREFHLAHDPLVVIQHGPAPLLLARSLYDFGNLQRVEKRDFVVDFVGVVCWVKSRECQCKLYAEGQCECEGKCECKCECAFYSTGKGEGEGEGEDW